MNGAHRPDQGGASPTNRLVQIVEDDATTRDSLAAMLGEHGYECKLFNSAEEYLASDSSVTPACLLLDYKLPGINGLELQQRLAERRSSVPVVVVSAHTETPEAVKFLQLGAAAVLQKPVESGQLISAIAQAIETSRVRFRLRQRFEEIAASVNQLSPREKTVLEAIVSGQLNKAIARALDVSVRTIEGDRAKIVDKFGAETTGEVVGKFAQYSLLSEIKQATGFSLIY